MEKTAKDVVANRQVKDRVFTLLFSEKKAQLELYNAMNGTHYTDCEALEVTTLEGALYMTMKNDVSFLLYHKLSLYEQQSTVNPNMPLRQLFYVSEQYKRMVEGKKLYGTTLVKIPRPQFIVLYNGLRPMPERQVLRLSDAYEEPDKGEKAEVSLELVTTVININGGNNQTLKSRSSLLCEYAQFVDVIHRYQKENPIQDAVKEAIDECIEKGILGEFLKKERDAVMSSILYEYNEEETLAYIAEEQYGLGHKDGLEEGLEQGLEQGIQKSIEMAREFGVEEELLIKQLMQKFELSREKVLECMKKCKALGK